MPTSEDYRSLELEAAAATAVARSSTALGNLVKIGVPAGALILAGWMIYSSMRRGSSNMTTPDKEEFATTQFPAPSLGTPRPRSSQGTIVIPQAPVAPQEPALPPPPVAPPMALPAPPPPEVQAPIAVPNDDEARRLSELERQRQEEERRKWERLRAPQVIADSASAGSLGAGQPDAARPGAGQEDDPNRRFLASVANGGVETAKATKNDRIDALVAQGTTIRGVLETAVQSDLPGMVRAVTTENVWSFDGRRILIPAGSRLVGEYKSGIAQGQTRVFVVWTRLLRSDGISVQLGSNGTDDLGRAGNAGFVDNHYLQRFGAAIMLSIVGGFSQFLSGYGQNYNNANGTAINTTDPVTGLVTTTQTGGNQNSQVLQARQIAAQNVSQTLTNIAQEALRNSINIPPTIYLDQGTRTIVFVRRDLDFSAFYPDPVKEALQELKHERSGHGPDGLP
ncbi:type IV secretion system protein VirB10 [Rhizobiales bacterium GAS113]|nr:type IV secretion system protein VirB10 [Rhizobiales bacterium GAS113]